MVGGFSVTIKRAISSGVFFDFKVNSVELVDSHHQYEDETVLLGEATMDNYGLLRLFLGVLSWLQVFI